jgi:hypothetical protein
MHVDAQQSLRLDTGEGTLGPLDIDSALIIDFAVQYGDRVFDGSRRPIGREDDSRPLLRVSVRGHPVTRPARAVLLSRTRCRGRIGIVFGCGLPGQTREVSSAGAVVARDPSNHNSCCYGALVRSWHVSEMPTSSSNVGWQQYTGKHLLRLSSSQFDPMYGPAARCKRFSSIWW